MKVHMKVERGQYPDREQRVVTFERRDDGWWANTESVDGEGWRRYASVWASDVDVRQLLNKEYDNRY